MQHEVTEMGTGLPYRNSVGLCIFNNDGLVLVAQRRDKPGSWQMPQGGVRKGEDPALSVFREMKEEIGNDKGEILSKYPEKLRYEFPDYKEGVYVGKYRGQEQIWFAIHYLGEDKDIDLVSEYEEELPEFTEWKWVELSEALNLIVDFKRPLYAKFIEFFSPISDALRKGEKIPSSL